MVSCFAKHTWNTVKHAWKKLSNVALDSSSRNLPPKSCIPSRAKMKMKRKRSSSSDKMEEMAFIKATTKLRSEVQYL